MRQRKNLWPTPPNRNRNCGSFLCFCFASFSNPSPTRATKPASVSAAFRVAGSVGGGASSGASSSSVAARSFAMTLRSGSQPRGMEGGGNHFGAVAAADAACRALTKPEISASQNELCCSRGTGPVDRGPGGSSSSLAKIMVAVFTIGIIGFLLDRVMYALQSLFTFSNNR